MAAEVKEIFLQNLKTKYGQFSKINSSLSLFNLIGTEILIYTRYSKIHQNNKTFYGLRDCDLKILEGHPSILCFLWDDQHEPLMIPFSEFEDIFNSIEPATDGQFKVQIFLDKNGTEFYIPKIGRFGVDYYYGWNTLDYYYNFSNSLFLPELNHSQIQTLIGSIGFIKNFDVWIPKNDRNNLDWSLAPHFQIKNTISSDLLSIKNIIEEIDVIWFGKDNKINSLFEVEHSTPVYSGLLRFNDIHIEFPHLPLKFNIVANIERKSLYTKQIDRPTFDHSGLKDICIFYDYFNIYSWHKRLSNGEQ